MKPLRPSKSTFADSQLGPVDLVVAARVDEQGGARVERLVGVLVARPRRCRTCAGTRAPASRARGCGRAGRSGARRRSSVVKASVKTPVSGVRLPPEWLPTSSTGPFRGDALEAAHLGAEVEAREQPQPGQRLADVVGVALVEVGLGDAHCALARRPRRRPPPSVPRASARPAAAVAAPATVRRAASARRRWDRSRCGLACAACWESCARSGSRGSPRPRRGRARARLRAARPGGGSCAARPREAAEELAGSGLRSCSATVPLAVSITALRRARLIMLRPITARSSRVGWISTTSVPYSRTFLASLPSRRP